MRADRDIAKRVRDMLTFDKLDLSEGFRVALSGDLNRLLGDYFELASLADVEVEPVESGGYEIKISAKAVRIKQFDTTLDVKRF